jgi:hypothetical protein
MVWGEESPASVHTCAEPGAELLVEGNVLWHSAGRVYLLSHTSWFSAAGAQVEELVSKKRA